MWDELITPATNNEGGKCHKFKKRINLENTPSVDHPLGARIQEPKTKPNLAEKKGIQRQLTLKACLHTALGG